jgi:hypothetical protein
VIANWGVLPEDIRTPAARDEHFRRVLGGYLASLYLEPALVEKFTWSIRLSRFFFSRIPAFQASANQPRSSTFWSSSTK